MLLFLLTQVDREDAPIIEQVYERYCDGFLRFAKSRLKRANIESYETDAEDVVQNAFMKICKSIKKVDLSRPEKQLKAYLFSIVANESNNFINDYKHVEHLEDTCEDIGEKSFFEALSINERYNQVVKAIERMDEKYSITLMYRYTRSMSIKNIAELMGISEKTVYTRISRGKALLLEMLEERKDV